MTTDPRSSTPDLADLLDLFGQRLKRQIRTTVIAKVEQFRPGDQSIDAKPLIKVVYTEEGEKVVRDPPLIRRVPVKMLRWGGFTFRCDLSPGDIVELSVSDREILRWLAVGADQSRTQVVEPYSGRTHDLNDVCAAPGPSPWSQAISGLGDGCLVIGRENGDGEIKLYDDGSIELGSQAAEKRGVARDRDEVTSTVVEDSSFWQWVLAVDVFIRAQAAAATAVGSGGGGGPVASLQAAVSTYAGIVGSAPSQQKAKITTSSGKVSTE